MAAASADLSKRGASSPEDLAEARKRLTQASGQGTDVAALIERAHADLEALSSVMVANPAKRTGRADFILRVADDKIVDVHQVAGDPSLASFSDMLRKSLLPERVPDGGSVDILRRGTLTCKVEATECQFELIGTEEAMNLATQESDAAKTRAVNSLSPSME